jgi:iron complex outermembrane receptor protein
MKRILPLSLMAVVALNASEVQLETIGVESTVIEDVAQTAQTSADVADALSKNVPSIDMSRRSGIANDIFIRGQKRDNITVEVDGTKVYGACPNRMDPPVSHIVANQIDTIEVIEGPYDVESFGTLSGGVKIKTKQPSKEFKSSVNVGAGSFNYKKFGASASGGNDIVRVAATISTESSDQYKDGNGDTISDQIDNYVSANPDAAGTALQADYKDMKAYTKNSAMVKAFITTAENQELRLSVTANRSDNVLYGNSKMDAIYDDSNIYNAEYNIDSISDIVKNVNLQAYHSDVDHPMGTDYRMSSFGDNPVMTNWLTTDMDGLKLKSTLDIDTFKTILGVDVSRRTWDGHYEMNSNPFYINGAGRKSIDNAVTDNAALFAKVNKQFGKFKVNIGMRYDDTSITNDTYQSNDYSAFSANILTTYNFNKDNKLFFGLGQASRVPDARELYFLGSMGNLVGTPDLDQTTNQEVDLGYELQSDSFKFKIKAFYSVLSDYIYLNKTNTTVMMGKTVSYNSFENIDATIYGAEFSASYYINDDITLDMDASYKKGEKDQAMNAQTDTDLADIAPLRGSMAINYEYANNSIATLKARASDRWDVIDSDNGEQELAGWVTLDAKVKHAVNKKFDLTVGINNMFDQTYAQSNTYADLTLITAGGSTDVMLMNEPGRYIYTNLDFKF